MTHIICRKYHLKKIVFFAINQLRLRLRSGCIQYMIPICSQVLQLQQHNKIQLLFKSVNRQGKLDPTTIFTLLNAIFISLSSTIF